MANREHLLEPAGPRGDLIGRDPRTVSAEDFAEAGIDRLVGLRAIRAKCLDCSGSAPEVRKCVCTDCPLWPLRMGSVPKAMRAARDGAVEPIAGDFDQAGGATLGEATVSAKAPSEACCERLSREARP